MHISSYFICTFCFSLDLSSGGVSMVLELLATGDCGRSLITVVGSLWTSSIRCSWFNGLSTFLIHWSGTVAIHTISFSVNKHGGNVFRASVAMVTRNRSRDARHHLRERDITEFSSALGLEVIFFALEVFAVQVKQPKPSQQLLCPVKYLQGWLTALIDTV